MHLIITCVTFLMATSLAFSQRPSCSFYVQQRYQQSCGWWGWDSCTRYRSVVSKHKCCSANADDDSPRAVCDSDCPSGEDCIQCDYCSQCSSGSNYPSGCPPKCFGVFDCPHGGNCKRTNYCGDCDEGYGPPRCGPLCFGRTYCLHGGTCARPNYCNNCNEGYASPRCDPVCNPSCLNGGTCTAPNQCSCRIGYTTPRCTPVCNPSCLNGGTCTTPNQCSCRTGYTTPRCTPVCNPSCLNGGTCTAPNQCSCRTGYTTPRCTPVCNPTCPHGGACIGPNQCRCQTGYSGSLCTPVCSPPCPNGGTCTQPNYCTCPTGYASPSCDPVCSPPCPNGGTCSLPNHCSCPSGYMSPNCDPVCNPSCLNGGTCTAPNQCSCRAGYRTPRCTPVCDPPCLNGGTCSRPNQCSCLTGYSVPQCAAVCNPSCLNGGTCTAPNRCSCRAGYRTPRCTPVCDPPCLNGGTCSRPNQCSCLTGYSVPQCAEVPTVMVSVEPTTASQPLGLSSTVLVVVISASGVAVTVIVIVLMVILVRRIKRQKDNEGNNTRKQRNKKRGKQQRNKLEMRKYETSILGQPSSTLDGYENTGQTNEYEETEHVAHSSAMAYEVIGPAPWVGRWLIPWSNLVLKKKILGNGHFGEIHKGEVKLQDEVTKLAVIAKLEENASSSDTEKFMEEFRTMSTIGKHQNVASILGACQKDAVWYVAWEYLPKGNIHSFLRENRDKEMTAVSPANLIRFVLDIAKGMQHIAASGVVHSKLSARNIVLSNDMVAMVSGFGLSKSADIYVETSEVWSPSCCRALESLTNDTFTTMSDVWSFGVVVWEIISLGQTPYATIESWNLASRLTSGYRLLKPRRCSDEVYNLMLKCWQKDPNKRPHFEQILEDLTVMMI